MGMDVTGKAPKSEAGEYFRATVWTWRPLALLLQDLYPDLTEKVQYLHSNDGDGLEAEDADELGRRIARDLRDDTVLTWIRERDAAMAAVPDEACQWCVGTGTRTDEVGVTNGMVEKGWCNGCDGKGQVRPFVTSYTLDFEDVEEFAAFVASSGGFEVW